jgi:hypothetical protein
MKLILTESQIKTLVVNERLDALLTEDVNIDNIKNKIKKLLIAGVAIASIISMINNSNLSKKEKYDLIEIVSEIDNTLNPKEDNDSIYQQKVKACTEYMEYALKNQNYTLESTGLNPETLVKASIEYDFDLPFLMAVAHLESCFGATPRAQRTNSVFSVGSYDDGRNVVTYSDPNESVAGYIKLMNNSYLVNGKTLLDLLNPNSFVNKNGHRFASDPAYEHKVTVIRNRILKRHPELK